MARKTPRRPSYPGPTGEIEPGPAPARRSKAVPAPKDDPPVKDETDETDEPSTPTPSRRRPSYGPREPDEAYLRELRREGEKRDAALDAQIDRLRAVRQLAQKVDIPTDLALVAIEVRDPTVADECQRVTATLSVNRPQLQITHAKATDANQENASLREHWTSAVLWKAWRSSSGPDGYSRFVDYVVSDGGGWPKLVVSKDRWSSRYAKRINDFDDDPGYEADDPAEKPDAADEPDETDEPRKREPRPKSRYEKYDDYVADAKRADVPFTLTSVDPRTLYPFWSNGLLSEIIEVQKRPRASTLRQYRLRLGADGTIGPEDMGEARSSSDPAMGTDTIDFVEYWNAKYVAYYVVSDKGGYQVDCFQHNYGRVPYFFGPGVWMAFWEGRKVGWSISETKRWLVENRSFVMTLIAQVASRDAMPPVVQEIPLDGKPIVGQDGRPLADSGKWKLGHILNTQPGGHIAPMQFAPLADSLQKYLMLNSDLIEKLETPRIKSEIGGGLQGAGFAVNTVLAEARVRFDPLCQSIERTLVELTRFLWHLARTRIKEPIPVYDDGEDGRGWITADPATDLTEGVSVAWKVDPMLPSHQILEDEMWQRRVASFVAGKDEWIEATGRNPDEVRQSIGLDEFRAGEQYKKIQQAAILAEAERGDLFANTADQASAEGIAQTGGAPGGGLSQGGVPGNVAQLMAGGTGATPQTGAPQPLGGTSGVPVSPSVPQQGQAAAAGVLQA